MSSAVAAHQNRFGFYVTGLKRESDPNWPLIATATASATDLTYKHSTKTKGGVWEGKAAIIVHVDCSALVTEGA